MTASSSTYRFLSAFTLVVFLSGVLGPAGASAAGILCDMDPVTVASSADDCCEDMPSASGDQHEGNTQKSPHGPDHPCGMGTFCATAAEPQPAPAPVISPGAQEMPAADLTGEIRFRDGDGFALTNRGAPAAGKQSRPPLFLLNASFLN